MAIPAPHFPEANAVLGPPAGAEDQVSPLEVCRGNGRIVSCWLLTPEELAEIAETGGVIWLSVWGEHTHPPVLVGGCKADFIELGSTGGGQ